MKNRLKYSGNKQQPSAYLLTASERAQCVFMNLDERTQFLFSSKNELADLWNLSWVICHTELAVAFILVKVLLRTCTSIINSAPQASFKSANWFFFFYQEINLWAVASWKEICLGKLFRIRLKEVGNNHLQYSYFFILVKHLSVQFSLRAREA